MTAYVVAGTQAREASDNRLYMMKWSKLYRTSKDGKDSDDEDEDEESDEESDEDHEAMLEQKGAAHPGGVNRVRAMPQAGHVVASWSDTGKVHMWNLQSHRKALDKPSEKAPPKPKPIYTCESHKEEGFALDFSPHDTGRFLSGSNDGAIFLWEPVQGGWNVGVERPFGGHGSSVEDVQWRRLGSDAQHVFASCSADRSIRVWDVREKSRKKSSVHVTEATSTCSAGALALASCCSPARTTEASRCGTCGTRVLELWRTSCGTESRPPPSTGTRRTRRCWRSPRRTILCLCGTWLWRTTGPRMRRRFRASRTSPPSSSSCIAGSRTPRRCIGIPSCRVSASPHQAVASTSSRLATYDKGPPPAAREPKTCHR